MRTLRKTIVLASFTFVAGCGGAREHEHSGTQGEALSVEAVYDLGPGLAHDVNSNGVAVGRSYQDWRAFRWQDGMLDDIHPPAALVSGAMAVDAGGRIVGVAQYGGGIDQAAVWNSDASDVTVIDTRLDHSTYHAWVNSAGQVAGRAFKREGDSARVRGFFWSQATGLVDIGDLAGGAGRTEVLDMNELGVVVGRTTTSADAAAPWRAFVWRLNEGMTDLGTLGGVFSDAWAINDSNQIVGSAHTSAGFGHAVIWTNGVIQDLHVAGSGDSSHASDVNNSGHVVGGRFVGGVRHATLWKDGLAIDLGAGDETLASDITDLGVIVGVRFGTKVGFVWRDSTEGAVDLPPVPGEVESWPWAVAGDFVAGHSNNGAGSIATVWKLQTGAAPADEDIGDLQDSVDDLANAGTLDAGESNSLDSKLEAANRQCERGNETAARHQIQAFINQVNAMIDSGRLDASTGQALIDDAEALLASLDCSG